MNDTWLAAIAAGDTAAFGRWMSEAEGPLRASLSSFKAQVDTEAVLQEALLRVWHVAPQFTPDGAPRALFRMAVRIARNLAVSELRRRKTVFVAHDEGATDDLAADWTPPDPLLRARIHECRNALPAKPREALDARLQAQCDEADEVLAERLAMRLNTFLQNFTRARRFLAECLRRYGVTVPEELLS